MRYFQTFRLFAEVAEFLVLERPERRLLVDLSLEPATPRSFPRTGTNPYPHRTTYTVTDACLIERFLDEVSVGDAIEAEGTFIQSDYVPYRTTCIDTTFFLLDYRRLSHPEQLIPAQAEVAAEALRRLRLH